jgi:hypothetical protein
MKTLHYVLVGRHLTGDSEIQFFHTRKEAVRFFKAQTSPLLEICYTNKLEEDEVYSFNEDKSAVRFDSGYDDELDSLLGECNHYFYLGATNVEDDVTHYVADFSEWVDESTVEFFNEQRAKEVWNERVDREIQNASEYEGADINREDESTWETEDGMTLFQETHHSDMYSDAYFGAAEDLTWTFRVGQIIFN